MSPPSPELLRRTEAVSDASAGGDHLLTVAVPPEKPVGTVLERVEEAHADAEYLHPDDADEPLRAGLERLRHVLHRYEERGTPDSGLVVYVGVVDGEVVEHVFDDLPRPVEDARYEQANEFDVEPLTAATGSSRSYGLLVVERGGAALGRLDGDRVEAVETIESDVMGKTRAGGQSAQRFARERERQKRQFFEEVAAEGERAFLEGAGDPGGDAEPAVDGLLVGGTTVTVEEFLDGEYLDHRLGDRILGGAYAVEYASEQGLRQLVERASDELDDAAERPARETLREFFRAIDADEPVAYGREATEEALAYGAVETTLLSADLDPEAARELERRTDEEGGDVVVVPTGFERGARFAEAFDGVGALLRFSVA